VQKQLLEASKMTTTIIGALITALAIEIDKLTQYRHFILPLVALGGIATVIFSLALKT
jgi:hypothetical protein